MTSLLIAVSPAAASIEDVEPSTPSALGSTPLAVPVEGSGNRPLLAVEGIEGDSFGGIVALWSDAGFAIAIDDELIIVDALGTVMHRIPVIGATEPRQVMGMVVVGSSTGEIHRISSSTGEVHTTWDTGDAAITTLDVDLRDVVYVTEADPRRIGTINHDTGEIDPSYLVTEDENWFVRVPENNLDQLVTASDSVRTFDLLIQNEPLLDMAIGAPLDDIEIDFLGRTAWVAGEELARPVEIDLSTGETTIRDYQHADNAIGVALNRNSSPGFATNSEPWNAGIYQRYQEHGVVAETLVDRAEGDVILPGGLAISWNTLATVVRDGGCACVRLHVEPSNPVVDDDRISVEFESTTEVTFTGSGFHTLRTVRFGREGTTWRSSPDGTRLTLNIEGLPPDQYPVFIETFQRTVRATVRITPKPEPEPEPEPEPQPAPEPEPAPEPDFTVTACPWITDSIVRLYSAYFQRFPDQGGFSFWFEGYSTGNWNLDRMSRFFSESPEFIETYGRLSDGQFVDLVYRNVLGRLPDPSGRQYWVDRMVDEGLTRGRLMIFFSESPEYVELTETATPLAGDFNWFAEGTTWYCGFGPVDAALPSSPAYVDVVMFNVTPRDQTVTIAERIDGTWQTALVETLPTGTLLAFWGVPYEDGVVDAVSLTSTGELGWILVYSPVPTPRTRVGWGAQ